MSISEIADALERAQGRGAGQYHLEGLRYTGVSDTSLKTMGRDLRLASADRPDVETFGVQKQ